MSFTHLLFKKYLSPTKENKGWLTLINSFLKHDMLNVINPKNVVKHIKVDEKAHYHTDVEKKCGMAQTTGFSITLHNEQNQFQKRHVLYLVPLCAFGGVPLTFM